MEVHISGLPEHLPEESLYKRLKPVLGEIGVAPDAFGCEKPKKRTWANVTFARPNHGREFLLRYGSQQSPSARTGPALASRLDLAGSKIHCKPSTNRWGQGAAAPSTPNSIKLRGLKYAAEEKANPSRKVWVDNTPLVLQIKSVSCGHKIFDEDQLVYMPEVEWKGSGTIKIYRQIMLIKLHRRVIKISIDSVVELIHSQGMLWNIALSEEPSFFIDSDDPAASLQKLSISPGAPKAAVSVRERVCNLDPKHAQVVGQCLVYQVQLIESDQKQSSAMKHHDLLSSVYVRVDSLTRQTLAQRFMSSSSGMESLMHTLSKYTAKNTLPFGLLYQLQALAWNAYLHPGTVLALAKELHQLHEADTSAHKATISPTALKMLLRRIDWPFLGGDSTAFLVTSLVKHLRDIDAELSTSIGLRSGLSSASHTMALVYKATVTPSRITLHGPELESNNRILRKFPDYHEYFIRVQFCDENGLDIQFNQKINNDKIFERFRSVLKNGLQIAGRTYTFLGFSHSSLRSHSAWFSAPFVDQDGTFWAYFNIIGALGDFSQIRSPARCAARIGQAFSETPFYLPLEDHNISVEDIADVTSPDGARVFSDGVGTMSQGALCKVWEVISKKRARPTAVQIRFRGSKGMLALDTSLTGSKVCLRPSMIKFESQDTANLEICDTASKAIPLVLNRQLIKILEDMGVEGSWFINVQKIELDRLRAVTIDGNSVARYVKRQDYGQGIQLHRLFYQAAITGLDYRSDGFLRAVVEMSVLRELRLLKAKARIPVAQGITLFGIMDETGFLFENEVYVTYTDSEGHESSPTPGPLLVTRSPALHPGDVQFPRNVIPPDRHPLRSHTNVIVFSRQGFRDLPSQLSGGDLDGDIYNVIWDHAAVPKSVFRPADYPRVAPLDLGRPVTKEDMAAFFVDFMKQDNLGVIATRHMILADQVDKGTLHLDCLKLAELHSTAVDFSKTGKPVNLQELPKTARHRPDFLSPSPDVQIVDKSSIELNAHIYAASAEDDEHQYSPVSHVYYKSEKILGTLYRAINEQQIWHDSIRSKARERPAVQDFWPWFIRSVQPRYAAIWPGKAGWTYHLDEAREIRGWYEHAVADAMAQYSQHPIRPITELEVFTGNIMNKSGVQTNRQRDNSTKLRDEFDRISFWITSQMRKMHLHDPDIPLTGYETVYDNLHRCLACVHIGGEKESGLQSRDYGGLQSFRIVAACALLGELSAFEKSSGL